MSLHYYITVYTSHLTFIWNTGAPAADFMLKIIFQAAVVDDLRLKLGFRYET